MYRTTLLALVAAAGAGCGGSATAPPSPSLLSGYPAPALFTPEAGSHPLHAYCIAGSPSPAVDQAVHALAAAVGLRASERCDWQLRFSDAPPATITPTAAAIWQGGGDEAYVVTSADDGRGLTTTLAARTPRGAYYAARLAFGALTPIAGGATLAPFEAADAPAFGLRGVVEGFYGPPYALDERTATIDCMAALRQNSYVYGPKGDPFAHERWAEPYPASEGAALTAAAAHARAGFVDFVWAVAPGPLAGSATPGTSIHFSSDADFRSLTRKIDSVRALGIGQFGLFLDDTIPSLQWPDDQAQFSSLAQAHRTLVNRLADYLATADAAATLTVVGTAYTSGNGDWKSYNQIFADGLRANVRVMWTGSNTFSETLQASDLQDIDAVLQRQVLIWDNYPLTPMAPVGRSVDLPQAALGLLSNPMLNENQQYPIAQFWQELGPLADYEWAPATYDAAASMARWQAQSQQLGGCGQLR